MERRTALALAAATAATVLAASAAFAANVGLLHDDPATPVGVLDAATVGASGDAEPSVVTVIVEDPPLSAAGVPGQPSGSAFDPVADDRYESDEWDDYGDAEDHDDDHEDDHEAREGHDDDD